MTYRENADCAGMIHIQHDQGPVRDGMCYLDGLWFDQRHTQVRMWYSQPKSLGD